MANGPTVRSVSGACSTTSASPTTVEWRRSHGTPPATTSGTTGNPKGVVYSHRSTFLRTFGATASSNIGGMESDVILPVVPMFHANAWGLAHAAPAVGAKLVMPGPDLSAPAIAALIEKERVTIAAGVPTIWMAVLPELKGRDTSSLRAIPCGGSAVPSALSEAYIRLVDRTKDVIKSGGEWISSVDLENAIMGHPKVAEAAVIGVPHPKWSERPLACVVVKPGEELSKEELLEWLTDKVAKWWLPDDVLF